MRTPMAFVIFFLGLSTVLLIAIVDGLDQIIALLKELS
jgi:hypothetical protein